ncbi:MAG: sugar phosphate isomerase/epimerase [Verrucomicrobiales bacterium]|jgi:sugar phosphate isomerase/epimerase
MINRRNLLKSSAAALAAAAASPLSAAADAKIRLGLVTYNWGKSWELPELLKNCEETGFEGVELRSTHAHKVEPDLNDGQRAAVKRLFSEFPVECVGPGTACEYHSADPAVLKKNIEETKAFVRLCHDIGGTGIKVRPNGLPKDVPVEKTLEQIGKSLNEVAEFASDFGVEIRTEVHGHGTNEIPNMIKIMGHSDHPNSTVCWNCNPADLDGDGLKANYLALKDRISTIHIHDLRNDAYPWEEFFALLKETGFSGWTLVEEGKVPENIPAAMKEVRTRWEELTA